MGGDEAIVFGLVLLSSCALSILFMLRKREKQ